MRRRGLTSATSLYVLRTLGHRHHTYSIGLTPYPMCVRRTSTLRMRLLGLLGDLGAVDYSIVHASTLQYYVRAVALHV